MISDLKSACLSKLPCYSRVLQYSQYIATERSFSRLPTHPYAQWWNVTFITINNSSFLPFSVSVYTVILESVEEWSPKDLPLFPFLGQYKVLVSSELPSGKYSFILCHIVTSVACTCKSYHCQYSLVSMTES